MINGNRKVFIDREGCLIELRDIEVIEERLRFGILNIARVLDNDINEARPILDARLPDGSRVEAVIPPASLGGSTLAIRKFLPVSFNTEDLVRRGSLPHVVWSENSIWLNRRRLWLGDDVAIMGEPDAESS